MAAAADARDGASGLRFKVDSRVECRVGRREWKSGTVVKLHYREDDWPPGKVSPYQIELDPVGSGHLIFAPADSSLVIRAEGSAPQSIAAASPSACLTRLQEEVAALQRAGFRAEPPRVMACCEQDGQLLEGLAQPFVVECWLSGPAGSAYGKPYRVRIKCNAAWPSSPAEVRICNQILHQDVEDDGLVDPDELEAARKEVLAESPSPLVQLALAVQRLLRGPDEANRLLKEIWDRPASQCAKPRNFAEALCHFVRGELVYASRRKHPRLFDAEQGWEPSWFDPTFLEVRSRAEADSRAWRELMREECSEVYSFPLFSEEFCELVMDEMFAYEESGLPVKRPNSMNQYGLILNSMGLEPMLDRLQREVWQPIARQLFPGIGSEFDSHHSFIVRYKLGEDLGLDMHTDDSEVTFNVCLGKNFEGAGLQICGNQASARHRKATLCYKHVKGRCLVHLGHRRHGADDITAGERLNLIAWNSSQEYRRSDNWLRFHAQGPHYEREEGPPDAVCVSYTHDRDYAAIKPHTEKTRQYKGRAWCPPRFAEYSGFSTGTDAPGSESPPDSESS